MPFNVRQKQEACTNGQFKCHKAGVTYVRYGEINVYGKQFRLLRKDENGLMPFTINGQIRYAPYEDKAKGINIVLNGGKLVFSTTFGLTVSFDGRDELEEILCDAYKTYVCGLCGNGDGVVANDYVDRNKVPIKDTYEWGQSWRVFDDSEDTDKTM